MFAQANNFQMLTGSTQPSGSLKMAWLGLALSNEPRFAWVDTVQRLVGSIPPLICSNQPDSGQSARANLCPLEQTLLEACRLKRTFGPLKPTACQALDCVRDFEVMF